jgi:pimeloyl-ACP methyl ester carboxylesterase
MKLIIILFSFVCLFSFIPNYSQEAIQVKATGEGPSILFLPGFANSSEVWEDTVSQLGSAYNIHLVDYAGFNGIEPVEMPWLPKVKADLVDYIKTNQLKNLTIIGHSLGGTLALYLASELDAYIKEIIVVDGLPHTAKLMFPNQESGSFSYDNPYANAQLTMPEENFRQMITQQVKMMCKNSDKHDLITQWIMNTDRKTYVQGYIDYLNFDATPYLKDITCEVYILSATSYGKAQTEQVYLSQYQNLENYDIRYAEKAAHYIMFDQPEWFYEQLNQILKNENE